MLFFSFNWTKDGKPFNLLSDPRIITFNNSGTFVIQNHGIISNFQGKYRCYASNALGTAMSEEIELIVPSKGFCFTFIMLFKMKNYGKLPMQYIEKHVWFVIQWILEGKLCPTCNVYFIPVFEARNLNDKIWIQVFRQHWFYRFPSADTDAP